MKKYFFICSLNFFYLLFLLTYYPFSYHGVDALPYDIDNKNIALLFTLTNEGGRLENLNSMKSIFADGSLGFLCESFHNKPAQFVYDKITEICFNLNEEATLLLYLNGHGGGYNKNFAMDASDKKLRFSKILKAISDGKPVKRLIVFVDTCHAEGAINEGFQGGAKLLNKSPKLTELTEIKHLPVMFQENNKVYFGEETKAYEELLVVVSSSADKLTVRGVFAKSMQKTFDQIKNTKNPTIYNFLSLFSELASKSGQYPYYKAIPEKLLSEPLFENDPVKNIPIKDSSGEKFKKSYILLPE